MSGFMKRFLMISSVVLAARLALHAAAGTEGASFLDIPVGAEPAALGSAYSARAENAYATIWNPAGLARVDVPELSAMYLSYLVDTSYQQASVAIPWKTEDGLSRGFGLSVQTLGSGDIDGRNETGEKMGDFTARFSAYSFAFGQELSERLSVGSTVKVIQETISDAKASAFGLDAGLLYDASKRLTLAAVVANAGKSVKLAEQDDPIPLQLRGGAVWRMNPDISLSGEGVYRRNGVFSAHAGVDYNPSGVYSLRAGYQTSHTQELGFLAGLTAGMGFHWKGQELSYAFVPFGDLGATHYFSINLRWSTSPRGDRAYPDLPALRARNEREDRDDEFHERPSTGYSDYRNLYDILSDDERKSLKKSYQDSKENE